MTPPPPSRDQPPGPAIHLPTPVLEPFCDLVVTIGAPVEVGPTPQGLRRMIPITGGSVTLAPMLSTGGAVPGGPVLRGRVLPGGADYQLVVGGTTAQLDARYVIELDDGARLFVHNTALRVATAEVTARLLRGETVDPAAVYFRCQPRFETAAPAWLWLGERQFVGTGLRLPDAVQLRFFVLA